MVNKPKRLSLDQLGQAKLLDRIEDRYEQLAEKLDELEAQLRESAAGETDEQTPPRKPR